jgi:AICAR transformylase/IMP cyclohydrolase PurH
VEVLAAPPCTADALEWLSSHKKNWRVMAARPAAAGVQVLRSVAGGLLAQTPDSTGMDETASVGDGFHR